MASISITLVFVVLMGVMYFLTTHLQSVLGYSALESRSPDDADRGGVILAAKRSVPLRARLGTNFVVARVYSWSAVSLGAFTSVDADTAYSARSLER